VFIGCKYCVETSRLIAFLDQEIFAADEQIREMKCRILDLKQRESVFETKRIDYKLSPFESVCTCLEHFICYDVFGASAKENYLHDFYLVSHCRDSSLKLEKYLIDLGLNQLVFAEIKKAGSDAVPMDSCPESKAQMESLLLKYSEKEHVEILMRLLEQHGIIKDDIVDFNISPPWTFSQT
jgi:hypothetical protein